MASLIAVKMTTLSEVSDDAIAREIAILSSMKVSLSLMRALKLCERDMYGL